MGPEWLQGAGALLAGLGALYAARMSRKVNNAVGNGFAKEVTDGIKHIKKEQRDTRIAVDELVVEMQEHLADPDAHKAEDE